MRKKILENDMYTMIKTDDNEYEILDKNENLILKLEGDCTKEQLKEQFENCRQGCIII